MRSNGSLGSSHLCEKKIYKKIAVRMLNNDKIKCQ
jgi:hypothetical protein